MSANPKPSEGSTDSTVLATTANTTRPAPHWDSLPLEPGMQLFPNSSYAYAQNLAAGNDKAQDKAQSKARASWDGAQFSRAQGIRGEKQDMYLHFVFPHAQSPENSKEFQTLARQLFSPAKENS